MIDGNPIPLLLTTVSIEVLPSLIMNRGSYLAAALNQDGTVNSPDNPAARGSVVSLFATGLGPFVPALPDNAWLPIAPPWPSLATPISVATVDSTPHNIRIPVLRAGVCIR